MAYMCLLADKPLFLRSQQFGPFDHHEDWLRAAEILGVTKRLSLRDSFASMYFARSINPDLHAIEFPDDALFAKCALDSGQVIGEFDKLGLASRTNGYIAVGYRRLQHPLAESFTQDFIELCNKAVDIFQKPLLLLPQTMGDQQILPTLKPCFKDDNILAAYYDDCSYAAHLASQCYFMYALPHHSLIFALRGNRPVLSPVLGDYYTHKNTGSMRLFGIDCFVLSDFKQAISVLSNFVTNFSSVANTIKQSNVKYRAMYEDFNRYFWHL